MKRIKNVLMWIPLIGLIVGIVDLTGKRDWFDNVSGTVSFINGVYLGITLYLIIELAIRS